MKTIWYSSGGGSLYPMEVSETVCLGRPIEQTAIAERCAADFHHNHDGWESRWPRVFSLHESEDGPAVATLEVDRESVPQFFAMHISKTPNAGAKA